MTKKVKTKYEKRAQLCYNRIVELKAATKKSPATIKIIVDPKLVEGLMKDTFMSAVDSLNVTGLTITWSEKV